MPKTYIFTQENSELIFGDRTLKTGEKISLKKEEDIKKAENCEYLKEKKDEPTNA